MRILRTYLKILNEEENTEESFFPIDSPGISKKPLVVSEEIEEDKNNSHKRIMIDLDGTLHKYSKGWMSGDIYDEPTDGAKKFINGLKEKDFEIIIFSSRLYNDVDDIQKKKIEKWLKLNDILFDSITHEKLPALFYIDDKAIRFKNNWKEVEEFIYNNLN